MARGIDHGAIFRSEGDRQEFIDEVGRIVVEAGAAVYAWSLLVNHFHFLVRTGPTSLSLLMRRLLTGHAVRFNRRYRRCGHLFQNRFKSILVDDDTYWLTLVRYIHLNPLRAGIVAGLDDLDVYPWTGHGVLVGSVGSAWQAVAPVLDCFGPEVARARRAYRRFVADGIGQTEHALAGGGFVRRGNRWQAVEELRRGREAWAPAERVLARPAALSVLQAALPAPPTPRRAQPGGIDAGALVERMLTSLGVNAAEVAGEGRRQAVVDARALLVHALVRHRGLSFNETARVLGMSKWSVRRALQRSTGG